MCSTTPITSAKLFGVPFGPTWSRLPTAFSPGQARAASVSSMMIRFCCGVSWSSKNAARRAAACPCARKYAGRHEPAVGGFALPVARRRLVVGEREQRAAAGQRQLRGEADVGHAGDRAQLLLHLPQQRQPRGGVRILRRAAAPRGRCSTPYGSKPGPDLLQRDEAADHQAGADQQHERERHFADHQQRRAAAPAPATPNRSRAACGSG